MGIQNPFRIFKNRTVFNNLLNEDDGVCSRAIKPYYCDNKKGKKKMRRGIKR